MVYWISKPKHLSMDIPSLPSFTFYLALIFFLLVMVTHKKGRKEAASKLPPGPWKLPIIGSLHHLLTPLPHRRLRELAMEYGPLMHLMMGEVSTVVASSTDAAQEILKTHDIAFADRPHVRTAQIITYDYRDMIFAPYGKYWRQVKKLCILELLTAKRVESFVAVREEEVSNLVRTISSSSGSTINLSRLLRELTTDVTARAAFGKKSKRKEMFVEAIKEVNKAGAGFDPSDIFPSFSWLFAVFFGSKSKIEEVFGKVDGIITSIVKERMKMGSKNGEDGGEEEDFLDVLLRMQQCNDLEVPLACDNVKAIVMVCIV